MEKSTNIFVIVFLLSVLHSTCFANCVRTSDCLKSIYLGEVGVRETGWNSGDRIKEYLKAVHLREGNPWCAAFVVYCHKVCEITIVESGWSPNLFPSRKLVTTPRQGDVFGLYFPSKKRIAHVGFVHRVEVNYYVTVEGNTGPDDYGEKTREGDGVYMKRRLKRQVNKFSRWSN